VTLPSNYRAHQGICKSTTIGSATYADRDSAILACSGLPECEAVYRKASTNDYELRKSCCGLTPPCAAA